MCGIFGIIAPAGQPVSRQAMEQMRTQLRHRGPDEDDLYLDADVALGNNRLSIIDLASGRQPIFNEDRSLLIVYNGEVYNHLEIRGMLEKKGHIFTSSTDTEAVLHAFEEFGPDCLEHFNGMFALAIWDLRRKALFLARDRLGIKPLYILDLNGGLAFASEPKALLHLLPGGPEPDWTALYRFLTYGYMPFTDTPFKRIRKFPAGHYAGYKNGALRFTRYYKPDYEPGKSPLPEDLPSQLEALLDRAVRLELMGDVPVGVLLSGGLDSSSVALFAQKNAGNLHSFALRFTEKTHDESADARMVAEQLGLQHHELTLSPELLWQSLRKVSYLLDEPFGDPTVLPLAAISEFARQWVKVVLTGWGGDEIFAGYPTLQAHLYAQHYRRLPGPLANGLIPFLVNRLPVSDRYMSFEFKAKRFIQGMGLPPEKQHFLWMSYFNDEEKDRIFRPEILEQVDGTTLEPVEEAMRSLEETDLINRIMHLDARFFLEGNGLFQADRITMAASLEARVPLLNLELMRFVNQLPLQVKMHQGQLKGLLKLALDRHLPKAILQKPKKGFGPPVSAWTRGIFSPLQEEMLASERVRHQGIFFQEEVKRLVDEHQARKADHGRKLWALLSFQIWYDIFILAERPI